MTNNDALERLKQRQRPAVPSRDISLTGNLPGNKVDTSISGEEKPELEIKTKQSTMRLEMGISDRLMDIARKYGLSREVLIEAMFLYCEGNETAWQQILFEAKRRAEDRIEIANRKRARTMGQRFNP